MNNNIELRSVRELMGMNYFIPAYQRGYRWTKSQVEDLLNDLLAFSTKKNKTEKEFYCLQPIVVRNVQEDVLSDEHRKSSIKNATIYEVIDGQQRLTTILIILKYLQDKILKGDTFESEYRFSLYKIIYETRPNLIEIFNQLDVINQDNIDYEHITSNYEIVSKWFDSQAEPRKSREAILNVLINDNTEPNVKVIWYELNDHTQNPVDTFLRINLGKIALTNGELIKALLLQESNFGKSELAELQQMEIAQEWDAMERTFHNENFWWFIANDEFTSSTRIEYVLNLYFQLALDKDNSILEFSGTDKDQTFRYFHKIISEAKSFEEIHAIWQEVKALFDQIMEWYSNSDLYHYIGFLIYKNTSIVEIFKWINLFKEEKKKVDENVLKSDIKALLVDKIKTYFTEISFVKYLEKEASVDETFDPLNEGFLNITYKQPALVRDTLLLYNLEYIINQNINNELNYRFSFKSFKDNKDENGKKIGWDIEHIDSFTDNPLDNIKDQFLWLENALKDLSNLSPSLKERIHQYLSLSKIDEEIFNELFREIRTTANEENVSEHIKNNICNLTLLDSKTNRGYGNALFITKRRIIIEKDKRGLFIPPLTKYAFLKYNNLGDTKSNWTLEDMKLYNVDIKQTLFKFL